MAAQRRASFRPGGARAVAEGTGATGPDRYRSGTARAVLGGVMVGALLVPPVAVLTAGPAAAAGMNPPLFDHPLDLHVDIGPRADPQPPADLGGVFGEISKGIGGLLANGDVPTTPANPAGTGSGTGRRGGSGSSRGGTTATKPAAPPPPAPTVDAALDTASAPAPTPTDLTAAVPTDEPGVGQMAQAAPSPSPTVVPAVAPVVAHGQLISASDGASIKALDTLAIILAGVGLIGVPAAGLRGRRPPR
jgi:hypothetical protein